MDYRPFDEHCADVDMHLLWLYLSALLISGRFEAQRNDDVRDM
jgi:hypothetical protein